ncbi:Metallo-peptidase family M12-domain-containing protein [Umbelopsis sp. PMI_123]|nr:Metallo-peptidase family M12-domain-containing protein [Umbelopsis sp. PMI_123]
MHFLYIAVLVAIWCCLSEAHSVNNKRLLFLESLKPKKLQIVPRDFYKRDTSPNPHYNAGVHELRHDDSIRLQFFAFNTTFNLHMIPNLELFHSDAVFHLESSGSQSLNHQDYRIYRGVVVHAAYSDARWAEEQTGVWRDHYALDTDTSPGVLGWARIIVRHDLGHLSSDPLFEGSFSVNGDIHHIKLSSNYKITKRSDDVDFIEPNGADPSRMVIYRDSDTEEVEGINERLDSSILECGMDSLLFNQQKASFYNHFKRSLTPRSFNQLDGWNDFAGISKFSSSGYLDHFPAVGLDMTGDISHPKYTNHLAKRASGCPTQRKINYMGAAADCTYASYYKSTSGVRMQIINDWNQASAVYERSFNISLGLINITVMDLTCPTTPASNTAWNQACSSSYTISDRLSDFSQWRGTLGNDGAGLWHLMTQCNTGTQVGIAWLQQLCQYKASQQAQSGGAAQYVSGTGVSSIIRDEWKVVAHEIGHGFGAIHDCTTSTCPCSGSNCICCPLSSTQCDAGGTYIMNPTSNVSTNDFSPCSITTICTNFPQLGTCLQEPGSKNVETANMCGNGIVETGEQCDTAGKDTACCDAATCKFKAGAVCDDYNDMCCNQCQLRPSSYECRPAVSNCDIAEYCTGNSSACPTDKHVADGSSCGTNLQCASGQCTSRDLQCQQRGGTTMNVTGACSLDSGDCQLSCSSPMGGMSCLLFTGNFIDGTPCGIGGSCSNGTCSTANFGSNALNWIQTHLNIFIPVVCVVGILLLCCLIGCCCRRRTIQGRSAAYIVTQPQPVYVQQPPVGAPYGQYAPSPPPPAPVHHQYDNWVDPKDYNGPAPSYSPVEGTRSSPASDGYEMTSPNRWRTPSPAHFDSMRTPTPSSRLRD